jgi:hypothetical protein
LADNNSCSLHLLIPWLTLLVLEKVKNQWKKVVSKPTMEKQNKQSQNNRKKN